MKSASFSTAVMFFAAIALLLSCDAKLFGQSTIQWMDDLDAAREIAAKEDKLILVHFWNERCGPCKRLDTFVFNHPDVARAVHASYVPVKVNTFQNPSLTKQLKIDRIPQDVFMTADGSVLTKQISPNKANHYSALMQAVAAKAGQQLPNGGIGSTMQQRLAGLQGTNESVPVVDPRSSQQGVESPMLPVNSGHRLSDNAGSLGSQHGQQPGVQRPGIQQPNIAQPAHPGGQQIAGASQDSSGQYLSHPSQAKTGMTPQGGSETRLNPFATASVASHQDPNAGPANNSQSQSGLNMPRSYASGQFNSAPNQTGQMNQLGGQQSTSANESSPSDRDFRSPNQFIQDRPQSQPPVGASMMGVANQPAQVSPQSGFPQNQGMGQAQLGQSGAGQLSAGQGRMNPAPSGISPQTMINPLVQQQAPTQPTQQQETAAEAKQEQATPELPPIGMEGYCPVTLVEHRSWTKGNENFGCIHRGRLYFFAAANLRDRFMQQPDRFAPMLSGYDPVMFAEQRQLVSGKRAHGVFFGDRVYMFDSEETLNQFRSDVDRYMKITYEAMGLEAPLTANRQQPNPDIYK